MKQSDAEPELVPARGELIFVAQATVGEKPGPFECPLVVYLDDGGLVQRMMQVRGQVVGK